MAMSGENILNNFSSKTITNKDGNTYKYIKDGPDVINISYLLDDNEIFRKLCESIVEEIQANGKVSFTPTDITNAVISNTAGNVTATNNLQNGKIE